MKNNALTLSAINVMFVFSATLSHATLVEDYQSVQQSDYQSVAPPEQDNENWSITIGAGAFITPKYEGADKHKIRPVPFFNIRYKDKISLSPLGGLRFHAIDHGNFTAGAGIGVNFGRDENESNHLNGLGDVDTTAEALIFASYNYQKISTDITLAQDAIAEGHKGFTIKASLGYAMPLPKYKLFINPSVNTTFASNNYMESFFGVSARQSSSSGLKQYDANSGFKDVAANLMIRYLISEQWSLNVFASYKQLVGNAADSPVVQKKSQISGGLFLGYTF